MLEFVASVQILKGLKSRFAYVNFRRSFINEEKRVGFCISMVFIVKVSSCVFLLGIKLISYLINASVLVSLCEAVLCC
jgi:ABC-type multidrug transport system permease subunit